MGLVFSGVAAVSTMPCCLVLCYFSHFATHLVLQGIQVCKPCSSMHVRLVYSNIMQFEHGPLHDEENSLFALDLIVSWGVWGLDIPISPILAPSELSKIHHERYRLSID